MVNPVAWLYGSTISSGVSGLEQLIGLAITCLLLFGRASSVSPTAPAPLQLDDVGEVRAPQVANPTQGPALAPAEDQSAVHDTGDAPSTEAQGVIPGRLGQDYMAASLDLTCIIKSNRDLGCWGYESATPIPAGYASNITMVSLTAGYACTINTTSHLACWEPVNDSGRYSPPPDFQSEVAFVATSPPQVCAVKTNGVLGCWGWVQIPAVPEEFQSGVEFVSCGDYHCCAVKISGDLGCWGGIPTGVEDDGQAIVPEDFRTGVVAVAAGDRHTCALKGTGELRCWGENRIYNQTSIPRGFESGIAFVSASSANTCAIKRDGEVGCWGGNEFNQSAPIPPRFSSEIAVVASAPVHTCVMKTSSSINCWGQDRSGQLYVPYGYAFRKGSGRCSLYCDRNECAADMACSAPCTYGAYKTDDGQCVPCLDTIENCMECNGPEECITCRYGYLTTGGECVPCELEGCNKCSQEHDEVQCDECLPGFARVEVNGTYECGSSNVCKDDYYPFHCEGGNCASRTLLAEGEERGCIHGNSCTVLYNMCLAEQAGCKDCCLRITTDTGNLWFLMRFKDGTLFQCDPPPFGSRICRSCDTRSCRCRV